jgi:hypothetical protein
MFDSDVSIASLFTMSHDHMEVCTRRGFSVLLRSEYGPHEQWNTYRQFSAEIDGRDGNSLELAKSHSHQSHSDILCIYSMKRPQTKNPLILS